MASEDLAARAVGARAAQLQQAKVDAVGGLQLQRAWLEKQLEKQRAEAMRK